VCASFSFRSVRYSQETCSFDSHRRIGPIRSACAGFFRQLSRVNIMPVVDLEGHRSGSSVLMFLEDLDLRLEAVNLPLLFLGERDHC
jgi:hypothetical protein